MNSLRKYLLVGASLLGIVSTSGCLTRGVMRDSLEQVALRQEGFARFAAERHSLSPEQVEATREVRAMVNDGKRECLEWGDRWECKGAYRVLFGHFRRVNLVKPYETPFTLSDAFRAHRPAFVPEEYSY